ncbi:DUF3307 domain-containing protein [Aliiroseovarius sp.]|uniref:DUF3307 domain-containing protein n=1 Tax=Aliiroseovarius sp. TaxID=1872442 RepID=UPI003BA85E3F
MAETLTALIFAHILADFLFQTDWMSANKSKPGVLLLHTAVVLATAQAATGHWDAPALLVLAAVHLVIDAIKVWGRFTSLVAFLTDQIAHLATVVAVAWAAPTLWATGAWGALDWPLPLMAILAGLIAATRAGGFAIGLLMKPHALRIRSQGLKRGGWTIGLLERGLVFVLILGGLPLGVGFLVAAKSVLRFGTATRDQRSAEYVIIGTLASFGWAILAAMATGAALALLPPLDLST